MINLDIRANILSEALPYILKYKEKTVPFRTVYPTYKTNYALLV